VPEAKLPLNAETESQIGHDRQIVYPRISSHTKSDWLFTLFGRIGFNAKLP
jgi:hypothetical protein